MVRKQFQWQYVLGFFLTTIILSGCSTRYVSHEPDSRYELKEDRGPDPSQAVAANDINEITPRWEPKSKAGNRSPYTVRGKTYHILDSAEGYNQTGVASWYGAKFHGHTTSNGEIFDMYKISAAHKSLPIPTYVRVTNLDNKKSIIVRVNDRGPFHGGRLIDLSYAAAVKLGFERQGTARVRVTALTKAEADTEQYFLQVGAFQSKDRALKLAKQLRKQFKGKVFVEHMKASNIYRVRFGPLTHENAQTLQQQLAQADLPDVGPAILVLPKL